MKHILLFICISFLIISCEWEPTEVYEFEIDQNAVPPDIEIVEFSFDFNQDTVVLYYDKVYYNFQSSSQEIKWIRFYLNDVLKGVVKNNKGLFKLESTNLYDVYHEFKVELFTNSGTGSIADVFGAEGFLFETKKWIIKVNENNCYNVISYPSNGYLKLKWQSEGNVSYTIYRNGIYGPFGSSSSDEFIDSTYVGEGTGFTIKNGNSSFGFVEVPKNLPSLSYYADNENNYYLKWDKPKYYSAVDSFLIYRKENYSSYPELVETHLGSAEPIQEIINEIFGDIRYYSIILRPKIQNSLYNNSNEYSNYAFSTNTVKCVIGYPSPCYSSFFANINNNEYIYYTDKYSNSDYSENDSLFRYNTVENKIVDRFRYNLPYGYAESLRNFSVSSNGNYVLAYIGDFSDRVFFTNGFSFSDYKIIDISYLYPYSWRPLKISDTGIGLISSINKKYLYDFNSETVLRQFDSYSNFVDYSISSDGKYFFLPNYLGHRRFYSYINNVITLEDSLSNYDHPYYNYLEFFANDPEKLAGWDKELKMFFILNFINLEIIKSFPLEEDEILDIDFFNCLILSAKNNLLVVRSLIDGEILYEVPYNTIYNKSYLCGSSIFHYNGGRYFLKL